MNKKDWWFGWLPYPSSWFMAIKLAIPAYIGATVVFGFEFWRYSILGGLIIFTDKDGTIVLFIISLVALIISLIWFLILTGLYKLFLKLLWSDPPKSLTLPKLRYLVIRDFGILLVSILPVAVIFTIYILYVTGIKQTFSDVRIPRLSYDIFLLRFSWLWFISAAYIYQWYTNKKSHHN